MGWKQDLRTVEYYEEKVEKLAEAKPKSRHSFNRSDGRLRLRLKASAS